MNLLKYLVAPLILGVSRLLEANSPFFLARQNKFHPLVNPIVGIRTARPSKMRAKETWAFGLDKIQIGLTQAVSHEVYQHSIKGAIAEVGVFRGVNARVMNYFFPDRHFYLFDTFEGFDSRDWKVEEELGFDTGKYPRRDFLDTNVELVMSRLPHKEMVTVRKGWFPETAIGLEEERFCYVFLDANMYQPIYKALHWFYPRLSNGGYIVVDLVNWNEYPGPKRAIQDFSREAGVSYIPVPSSTGSVVIGKPLVCRE